MSDLSKIDLKITLGVGRVTGATRTSTQAAFTGDDLKQLKLKIFERDDHTCKCCGFRSEKYQDIFFLDRNPKNFSDKNLVTTCIFCHQVFHLEKAAAMRSGVLVWLPEISQTDLHHIARAIYVARVTQGPMADGARAALDAIMARREQAEKRIGTDDPTLIAHIMGDFMEDREYAARAKKLDGIRVFPLDRRIIKEGELEFNQFPQILAYWRSKKGPFGDTMPATWQDKFEQAMNKAA